MVIPMMMEGRGGWALLWCWEEETWSFPVNCEHFLELADRIPGSQSQYRQVQGNLIH